VGAPPARVDHRDYAEAARSQFSIALSCPESRVTTTPADPLPREIAADPERLAVYRANHAANRREVFDVEGCDRHLRIACDGLATHVFCVPDLPPIAIPAMAQQQSLEQQLERVLRRQARLGILRSSASGKVVVGVVLPGSSADGKLRPADVILRAAGEPVPDGEALSKVVRANAGKPLELTVQRDGQEIQVAVDVPSP
jgi:hypothetical protein